MGQKHEGIKAIESENLVMLKVWYANPSNSSV